MPTVVTLEIFSGRPNPSWELDDEQISELGRLLSVERTAALVKPTTVSSRLGYRGFTVESARDRLPALLSVGGGVVEEAREAPSVIDDESEIEKFLLSTGRSHLDEEIIGQVEGDLKNLAETRTSAEKFQLLAAPPYNPGKWNNDPNVLRSNNCYNYGCDRITNSFAQPGRGSGSMYSALQCGNVGPAAQRDGLATASGPTGGPPANCHYAALVMAPNQDFHWYRFDSNGRWSHKPGGTPVTDRDNSGQVILNPETANRGIYTSFCGYYLVNIGNIRIN